MSITNAIETAIAAGKKSIPVNQGDYHKDGLLYCGRCNTQKQCEITLFGRIYTPMCLCKCQQQQQKEAEAARKEQQQADRISKLRASGIHDKQVHHWTFEADNGGNPRMADNAMRYFSKWKQMHAENIGLLFWGGVGTGKTFYAACIANALIDSGVPVLMTNFSKLINELSGFGVENKNDYIQSLNNYKLLVIDDLAAERQTDFALELVYHIIDSRYKSGQPLIVTTNLTLDELKNTTDLRCKRIYDRVLEMCVPLMFEGESIRAAVAKEKIAKARKLFG